MTLPPLLVQIVFHPGSTKARSLAAGLHHALNDDPAVPGLRIPTVFVAEDGTGFPPATGAVSSEAERVFVLVLADDWMTATAADTGDGRRSWGDFLVALNAECRSSQRHRFVPAQLDEHAWPVDERLSGLNFIRAWNGPSEEECQRLLHRRVIHELCRHLMSQPMETGTPPLPVTIFISHTKLDLEENPRVVRELLQLLTAEQPEKTWFDSGDIEAGSQFAERIEAGVRDAALIAVLTDAYAAREWCRKEVLLAKQLQRPVIVVDALRQREIRSFPYTGNVPVLRWNGDSRMALDLLLRETLRHLHARATLNNQKNPNDEILPSAPELVTVIGRPPETTFLYPDPPLGGEELAVLKRIGIQVETPLQRFAKRVTPAGLNAPIALSISESGDTERYGLGAVHLDAAAIDISRYLLLAGTRLAYGGHLGETGYSQALFELVRSHALPDVPPPERILSYIGWPVPLTVGDRAKYARVAQFVRTPRPPDLDESLHPDFVPEPNFFPAEKSPLHRYAWARGMTQMRESQTAKTAARVVLGGRMGPAYGSQPDGSRQTKWYAGRIPGVLEEILVSMKAGQPVYLVGAFGGCARLVFDLLEGQDRREMSWDFQKEAPQAEGMRELFEARGTWWDYPEMTDFIRRQGFAGLKNGLDPDENRLLATSRIPEVIVELLLEGLRRVFAPN